MPGGIIGINLMLLILLIRDFCICTKCTNTIHNIATSGQLTRTNFSYLNSCFTFASHYHRLTHQSSQYLFPIFHNLSNAHHKYVLFQTLGRVICPKLHWVHLFSYYALVVEHQDIQSELHKKIPRNALNLSHAYRK